MKLINEGLIDSLQSLKMVMVNLLKSDIHPEVKQVVLANYLNIGKSLEFSLAINNHENPTSWEQLETNLEQLNETFIKLGKKYREQESKECNTI